MTKNAFQKLILGSVNKKLLATKKFTSNKFIIASEIPPVVFLETGVYEIDSTLGGGLALGRVMEICGPEAAGKTTLATIMCAAAQKQDNMHVIYYDGELTFDLKLSKKYGLDTDAMLIYQTPIIEEIIDSMIETMKAVHASDPTTQILFVIDSIGTLVTQLDTDKRNTDNSIAVMARRIQAGFQQYHAFSSEFRNSTVIYINHARADLSPNAAKYGLITRPGGTYIKFMNSQVIQLRKVSYITKGSGDTLVNLGVMFKGKIIKSKVSPPGGRFEIPMLFASGISKTKGIIAEAWALGIIYKLEKSNKVHLYKPEDKSYRTWSSGKAFDEFQETDEIEKLAEEIKIFIKSYKQDLEDNNDLSILQQLDIVHKEFDDANLVDFNLDSPSTPNDNIFSRVETDDDYKPKVDNNTNKETWD